MEELILKMAACLLAALALGFVLGWLIKRAFANEKFGTQIEGLEIDLAQQKEQLLEREKETEHVKQQFLSNQEVLHATSLKMGSLEENVAAYEDKITTLHHTIQEKENILENKEKEHAKINQRLTEITPQLEEKKKEAMSHLEELARVKEHHTLLKDEVSKLKSEQTLKHQEFDSFKRQIEDFKASESKLLEEQHAKEQKISQLQSSINEKNIASIELNNKVKEIDVLNQKTSELKDKLRDTEQVLQKTVLESDALNHQTSQLKDKLRSTEEILQKTAQENTHYKKSVQELETTINKQEADISKIQKHTSHSTAASPAYTAATKSIVTPSVEMKNEGFDFMRFAKKTLKKMTETSDEIIAKGDKALKDYKHKDS